MQKLIWTDAITMNYGKLDKQHKRLFELTNNLMGHSESASNSEIVSDTLTELVNYTTYHFDDEEKYYQRLGYPKLEEHKKIHEEFLLKVSNLTIDVVKGKENITPEILSFLSGWLKEHTTVDDQDFKNFL